MKFGKKLERLLLAEMGVCLIVLLLSVSDRCSSMAILLSTLFQIFMIIYIIVVLVHPLQAYAKILEHLNKTEFEREKLRMAPAGVPFVKETYSLLDRYAAYKTRKNNAQILNKQTELTALQSQINPHFLYNTLTSVGNDFAEQATIAVDMLVEKMGTKGKVAVMQGAPTAHNHAERYQAHLDALAKYPDIQVIDGGIDNDNVETAQSQAAAVLAANPDLTGYLNCDACGSGVAAAIEEKGMQDKVTFVAMDNLIEILDYVKTGTITATSSTLPQEQGMYAVLMAYQAAQGMPLPANVDTGIGRITADNIDEWIETVSAK